MVLFPSQTEAKRRLRGSYYIPRPTANLLNIEHPKSWRDTEQGGRSRGARAREHEHGSTSCRQRVEYSGGGFSVACAERRRSPPGALALPIEVLKAEAGGRGQRAEAGGPTHRRSRSPQDPAVVS